APSARARRITACDSRESSKSICKEIALQRPKSGKFDYLRAPSHSAHSMVSEFFTDDSVTQSEDWYEKFQRADSLIWIERYPPKARATCGNIKPESRFSEPFGSRTDGKCSFASCSSACTSE